jgi:hypothetical protein
LDDGTADDHEERPDADPDQSADQPGCDAFTD